MAAALAFGVGALWLRHEIYAAQMDNSVARAKAAVYPIEARWTHQATDLLPATYDAGDETFVIIDDCRQLVEGVPWIADFVAHPLEEVGFDYPDGLVTVPQVTLETLHPYRSQETAALGGRTLPVVTTTFRGPSPLVGCMSAKDNTDGGSGFQRLTLLVLATPWDAERAVDTTTLPLGAGVPAAAMLVGLLVWVTTGRALRPVAAIQGRLSEITGSDVSLRVPVPPGDDEIARLARTTNATLDRLESALEQQLRFVADASHELRTPLASLRADLELALLHPEAAPAEQVLADALGDTERLQELTEDLLLLARLDHSRGKTSGGAVVPLTSLVRELVMEAEGQGEEDGEGADFAFAASRELHVFGHQVRLRRLIRNLLDNAERHAATRVQITVAATAGTAVVEVANDGPGIPAEDRERIFDRFRRLDDSRTRDSGGTGLGLSIAREIARMHSGELWAAEGDDMGACFVLEIPLHVCNGIEGDAT